MTKLNRSKPERERGKRLYIEYTLSTLQFMCTMLFAIKLVAKMVCVCVCVLEQRKTVSKKGERKEKRQVTEIGSLVE